MPSRPNASTCAGGGSRRPEPHTVTPYVPASSARGAGEDVGADSAAAEGPPRWAVAAVGVGLTLSSEVTDTVVRGELRGLAMPSPNTTGCSHVDADCVSCR